LIAGIACEAYPGRRHDKQDRFARPIGLPAICQLQSVAKPLSVDANAVP
jgi:hypothetical protein